MSTARPDDRLSELAEVVDVQKIAPSWRDISTNCSTDHEAGRSQQKERMMRRILTILVLLGLTGCSGDGVGQLGPFGRLDVTPTLQDACDGVAGGDPLIEAAIHVAEEARLDGGLYTDGVAATLDSCTFEGCITCFVAVLNQVFGI